MEPSLNLPVACKARFAFTASVAVAGATVMLLSVAVLTISDAEPVVPAKVAEMVAVAPPGATAVATPMLPAVLLIVATGLLLDQTTSCEMFWVVVSLNVPIAVKVWAVSGAMVAPDGPTAMDWMVAVLTSNVAIPVTEPSVAVMLVDRPAPTAWARPVAGPMVAAF